MIRIVRSVAAALALVVAVPSVALADAQPGAAQAKGDKARKGNKKSFPMKADAFKQHIEKRIANARTKLDGMLERRQVPEATRAQIKKDFDAGAVAVRAAADRVAKDGEVTQDEAKQVRELAKDLKRQAKEKYGIGGKGKGKGKNKDKGTPARAS
jgi:hypothetical protein